MAKFYIASITRRICYEEFEDKNAANKRAADLMWHKVPFAAWTPDCEPKFYGYCARVFLQYFLLYTHTVNLIYNTMANKLFEIAFSLFEEDDMTGEVVLPTFSKFEVFWESTSWYTEDGRPYKAICLTTEFGQIVSEFITEI